MEGRDEHQACSWNRLAAYSAGPDFDTLDESYNPIRINTYGEPWPLKTGLVEMPIASTWNQMGIVRWEVERPAAADDPLGDPVG